MSRSVQPGRHELPASELKPIKQLLDGGSAAAGGQEALAAGTVLRLRGAESLAAGKPAMDTDSPVPAALASSGNVDAATHRRAVVAIGIHGAPAAPASDGEQLRVLQAVADEGPEVDRGVGHADGTAGDAIAHVELERNEVKTVDVFPVIETAVNLRGIAEETEGVEPRLVRKKIARTHNTVILIKQSASLCHRGTATRLAALKGHS